jgi:hypothetical protein
MTPPCTAQSRPTTSRPQTAVSTNYEGSWITAVFEGRGVAREVGLAALEKETGRVMLVQVGRSDEYLNTSSAIRVMTRSSSQIARHMSKPSTKCTYIGHHLSWSRIPHWQEMN